jgi:hypothetical protein
MSIINKSKNALKNSSGPTLALGAIQAHLLRRWIM